jgi:hypothetical protein
MFHLVGTVPYQYLSTYGSYKYQRIFIYLSWAAAELASSGGVRAVQGALAH